jgi:hypothetical protein
VHAFVVPALRNLREERGTRFVGTVKEIKGRATRPNNRAGNEQTLQTGVPAVLDLVHNRLTLNTGHVVQLCRD